MGTSSVSTVQGQQGAQAPNAKSSIEQMDLDGFLKLLIAELQNQDPMQPMDNNEILQQVSQIREIQSNQNMVTTLDAVKLGQNMSTATALIGWDVLAMTDEGDQISGRVDAVTFEDGAPRLKVGDNAINLKNISAVYYETADSTETTDSTQTTQ